MLCQITSYWMITCDDIPLKFAAFFAALLSSFKFSGLRLWISAACVTSVATCGARAPVSPRDPVGKAYRQYSGFAGKVHPDCWITVAAA